MDTKWTSNNGSNSDNPNHLPGTGHRHNSPQSTNSAVQEETEKQENPISDRLDKGRGNDNNSNNSPTEHSDSTMSNPVNDKVDTSEKSSDSTEDNTPFDLSYFDGIYKTKEKDDPLDLSYFESPYDKNKLEEYLKSNVESGNQLAYNKQDFRDSLNRVDNILAPEAPAFFDFAARPDENKFQDFKERASSVLEDLYHLTRNRRPLDSQINSLNDLTNEANTLKNSTGSRPYKDVYEKIKQEIDFAKQKAEDINTFGATKNTGISSESERQQINDALDPAKSRLQRAYESGDPTEIENAKQNYERVANRVNQEFEGSEVSRRAWNVLNKPEVFYQKMEESYGPTPETPTTSSTSSTSEETPTTSSTPETPTSTTSTTEDDLRSAHEESTLAAMDLAEALRTSPSNIEDSDTARALQSGEFGNITSAEEMRRAMIEGAGFPLDETTDAWARWAAAQNRERLARESASTPRGTERGETPTADVTPTEETSTTETPTTEVAMGESSETPEEEIPETIDEEPSEETHSVMDAIEGLDDSRRWWEFGSEDYERTRHQIARISPTAEEEFMDFADLINDIVSGSAGDKVKAVLKLISKAAYDTFNILPKVCVDVAKDIVYRLIKGDYDTSGLTEGEQKQVERFSHNRQNVNMMNAMLDTMDKPIESSIRGKGRGQATDESDYNEGLIEQTNDVTSDVTKKYIISQPWLFKAIQRW